MEEENKELKPSICDKVLEETTKTIDMVLQDNINSSNLESLEKLIDIYKDIKNVEYWKKKEEFMRYRGNYSNYMGGDGNEMYSNYGRRGRYRDGGSYGRRGVDAKYRGEDMMNDIYESYQDYTDNSSYGHDTEADKAYEFMVEKGMDFVDYLEDEAKTPKQKEMIRKFRQEISSR